MGETQNILNFRPAGLTAKQVNEGATVVEATHAGVTYRVIGTITDPMRSGRRTFKAYRVTELGALHPAGKGGAHKTRKAAIEQAEADLADVLRDRRKLREPAEPVTPSDHATVLAKRLVQVLAADAPPPADPALDDNVHELVDRMIRRSHYVALKVVLDVLDGWRAQGSDEPAAVQARADVMVKHVGLMINAAARELRVPRPYRPADE